MLIDLKFDEPFINRIVVTDDEEEKERLVNENHLVCILTDDTNATGILWNPRKKGECPLKSMPTEMTVGSLKNIPVEIPSTDDNHSE